MLAYGHSIGASPQQQSSSTMASLNPFQDVVVVIVKWRNISMVIHLMERDDHLFR